MQNMAATARGSILPTLFMPSLTALPRRKSAMLSDRAICRTKGMKSAKTITWTGRLGKRLVPSNGRAWTLRSTANP